ncbi:hypothetical protein AB0D59_37530 [Streptomyces sp. NPDC048417]|uniref:hypothetical protein n=1 Tax=Streptomyces sp. NPDC048417 TaxID=3155387 RepID=UPI0034414D84
MDRESLRPPPGSPPPSPPSPKPARQRTTAETLTPQQAQARKIVKECERRLARYQAALEAGSDPAVVTQWINEAQAEKEAARKKPDTPPAATRKKETPLSVDQIREITENLGDIAQRVQAVDAEKKNPLYEVLGITISTNTQVGPQPLGRGPRPRIATASVRGGT